MMLLLFKCETCHHEWDDTRRESFCDWCGEYGHILEDKTGKYNFIFKGVKSLLVFLILFGTIGIFLLCCSNSRVTDSFDSVIIDSSAFIITFPTDFDSVLKNKTFACPIIQTVHFTQLDTTLVIVEEDTLKTVFLLYILYDDFRGIKSFQLIPDLSEIYNELHQIRIEIETFKLK